MLTGADDVLDVFVGVVFDADVHFDGLTVVVNLEKVRENVSSLHNTDNVRAYLTLFININLNRRFCSTHQCNVCRKIASSTYRLVPYKAHFDCDIQSDSRLHSTTKIKDFYLLIQPVTMLLKKSFCFNVLIKGI